MSESRPEGPKAGGMPYAPSAAGKGTDSFPYGRPVSACPVSRLFTDAGLVSPETADALNERRARSGAGFIPAALAEGALDFDLAAALLNARLRIEVCDLNDPEPDAEPARLLGHSYCMRFTALPVRREGQRLFVAMADPLDRRALSDIADLTGLVAEPMFARADDIRARIDALLGSERMGQTAARFTGDAARADADAEPAQTARLREAPAVRLVEELIESAALRRASDVHIEPDEGRLRVRFRVDGRLTEVQRADLSLLPNMVSRLKVLAGLNIAERRLPQDGRFTVALPGGAVDCRLSTLPTVRGEKAALRLLYGHAARLKKDELGFFPEDVVRLTELFTRPYGAVIVTGPTGSGKSTTLASFLSEIATDAVHAVTVEDPVEFPLPGVNHMNVEPAVGLTFANALRHILRQDPDIIMVGEIRDAETAKMAVQAAITGHLVLSTLHTNDAAGVLERLVDMGVEAYLVAAALAGVIAQRLVRRLCPFCRVPAPLTEREALLLNAPPGSAAWAAVGCPRCAGTGYAGRFAVYETLILDDRMRRMMSRGPGRFTNRLRSARPGFPGRPGLRENALQNVRLGHTSAAEAVRVLNRETPE